MSSLLFYKASAEEKRLIFQEVAKQKKIQDFAVEKDWWVTLTLDITFSDMDIAEHLLFKGGTSLSKAWHLMRHLFNEVLNPLQ
tara:strand:+ start:193 stop:441 length:249 start_codon:yes stop_codon:yes gene_type:complete